MKDKEQLMNILETQDYGGVEKTVDRMLEGDFENMDYLTKYIGTSYTEANDMDDFKSNIRYAIDQLKNIEKTFD